MGEGLCSQTHLPPSPAVDGRELIPRLPCALVWGILAQGRQRQKFKRQGAERVHTAPSLPPHPWQRPQLLVESAMAPALASDLTLACLLSLPKPGGSFWSPLWAASAFLSPP